MRRLPVPFRPFLSSCVHRRGPVPAVTAFQVRNRNAPVTIAGNTVTPLHRLPVQPAFYRGYRGQPVSGSSRGTLVGSPAAVQGAPMTARPGYSFHGTSGSTSADPRQFSHPPNAEPGQFNRPVTSQGATPPVRSSYTRSSDNNQITVSPSGSRSSDSEGIEPSSRPAFVQDGSSHQGEDTVGISQPHETGSAGGGSPHPGGSAPHPSGGGSPHPSGGGSAPHPSGGGGGGGASHTGSSGGGGGGTHGK